MLERTAKKCLKRICFLEYLGYFAYSYSQDAHDKKLLNVAHSFVLLLFAMFDSCVVQVLPFREGD